MGISKTPNGHLKKTHATQMARRHSLSSTVNKPRITVEPAQALSCGPLLRLSYIFRPDECQCVTRKSPLCNFYAGPSKPEGDGERKWPGKCHCYLATLLLFATLILCYSFVGLADESSLYGTWGSTQTVVSSYKTREIQTPEITEPRPPLTKKINIGPRPKKSHVAASLRLPLSCCAYKIRGTCAE